MFPMVVFLGVEINGLSAFGGEYSSTRQRFWAPRPPRSAPVDPFHGLVPGGGRWCGGGLRTG
jgi:hypothetical protein